jgi:hypothetical protein
MDWGLLEGTCTYHAQQWPTPPSYQAIWPKDRNVILCSITPIFGHELGPILCSWQSEVTLYEPMVDSTVTIHNLQVGDPLQNSTKYANSSLITQK